jgi:hypothetical protein
VGATKLIYLQSANYNLPTRRRKPDYYGDILLIRDILILLEYQKFGDYQSIHQTCALLLRKKIQSGILVQKIKKNPKYVSSQRSTKSLVQ